jgi:hypothetical protein
MERDKKTPVANTEPKSSVPTLLPQMPRPRAMSLDKAKKLIRKTSVEHEGLFRRLAK